MHAGSFSVRSWCTLLLATALYACAEAEPTLPPSPEDVEAAAQSILGVSMAFNSAVYQGFDDAKDDIDMQPRALFERIDRTLHETSGGRVEAAEASAMELVELTRDTDDERLNLNLHTLLTRFGRLLRLPDKDLFEGVGNFQWSARDVHERLELILRKEGSARTKKSYYYAPAFNVVASARIFALAASGASRGSIDDVFERAIATNEQLVGSGEDDDLGELSDWVASHTPGPASVRTKCDNDPIIHTVRRALEEQQRALAE